jgi:cation diffusion facilitator CzcD-associated flavoprotein CzcO
MTEVVIVGAGMGGLSTAVALKDRGIETLVVDQADHVGASWRRRYDRLRLNSNRGYSHLPGRRFPKGTPVFPAAREMAEHLERHAEDLDLKLGTTVERIDPAGDGWVVRSDGGNIEAGQVVVATGYERAPFIPDWPGRETFAGRLLHSAEYRNAEPFRDQRVLVVGPGCSGMEIAYDLTEGGAAQVWLAVRTPPNIVLRTGPGGLPGDVIARRLLRLPTGMASAFDRLGRRVDIGDLSEFGLPVPEEMTLARFKRLGVAPAIVDKEVIESIKARRFDIVRGVVSLDADGVALDDGSRVTPDAVICATGYRYGLEPLVGHLDVLDERGVPRAVGPQAAAPGLRFVGYVHWVGELGHMAREGAQVAKAIARELKVTA